VASGWGERIHTVSRKEETKGLCILRVFHASVRMKYVVRIIMQLLIPLSMRDKGQIPLGPVPRNFLVTS